MAILNLTKTQRQKVRIFVVCICVSVFSWALFAMPNKYTYIITAAIRYVDAPDNTAVHPLHSDSVDLQVEGSGCHVVFSRLRLQSQEIDVDISPLRSRDWVVFSNHMGFS